MKWKDFFTFDKRDQISILLLLVLITLSGVVHLLVSQPKGNKVITATHYIEPEPVKRVAYPVKLKEGNTIELNSTDTTVLKQIPGIGSSYAKRIVNYRTSLGGYYSLEQLQQVWGMDDSLYTKILPFLTLDSRVKSLKINTLNLDQLKKHPYINYKQAKAIADIRQRKGKITSINRLELLEEFTEKDIERLKPYLSFD